ncbi:MAG: glycosyltransferase [Clostridia bacterium]|nr:glycosyltransferase [Clostridia bacterium]
MNIGLFIDAFYPMVDGVINVVDNYAKELSRYADVTVFCPLEKGVKITDKPYKIVQCFSFSVPNFDYSIPLPFLDVKFKRLLKKYKLDIVHVHSPFNLCRKGKRYAKKHKIPLVATIHSQYKKDFEKVLKLKLSTKLATFSIISFFNSCDECWTVNKGMLSLYKNQFNLKPNCVVVPNATDHTPIQNVEEALKEINDLYNLEENTLTFLYVGRITFQKNIPLILEALAILKDKGVDFKMLFVGSGSDEEKLTEYVAKLNLTSNAISCGKITDKTLLQKLYARAKLLLFPSLYDANSLVQIESACQKTPTLFVEGATTACEIIKDKNGFLASPNKTSYADEILRIISSDALYENVCQGCYKDLYLTWKQSVKSVFKEYQRLIEEKNNAKTSSKRYSRLKKA